MEMSVNPSITVRIRLEGDATLMPPVSMWAQDRWEMPSIPQPFVYLFIHSFNHPSIHSFNLCLHLPFSIRVTVHARTVTMATGTSANRSINVLNRRVDVITWWVSNKQSQKCVRALIQCTLTLFILEGHLSVYGSGRMAVCVWGWLCWWWNHLLWNTCTGIWHLSC